MVFNFYLPVLSAIALGIGISIILSLAVIGFQNFMEIKGVKTFFTREKRDLIQRCEDSVELLLSILEAPLVKPIEGCDFPLGLSEFTRGEIHQTESIHARMKNHRLEKRKAYLKTTEHDIMKFMSFLLGKFDLWQRDIQQKWATLPVKPDQEKMVNDLSSAIYYLTNCVKEAEDFVKEKNRVFPGLDFVLSTCLRVNQLFADLEEAKKRLVKFKQNIKEEKK